MLNMLALSSQQYRRYALSAFHVEYYTNYDTTSKEPYV